MDNSSVSYIPKTMRLFFKIFGSLFFFLSTLALLAVAAGGYGIYYLVVEEPCPELDPDRISSILGRESPVYYRDGENKIGVLFQDFHRQYLEYEQIPESFINAIVAAEDRQFFIHYGIDFPGIARAMIVNYKAGRIVQGGSTISQQTVKNLFKRSARSASDKYKAKLNELLYALRLEYRYSKEDILKFYSNQFYVSGNGHGLGVAARYYFNKEPMELSLLESAFIAGSVKQPNYYNPFIKKNKESARKAQVRAEQRAAYVLGQMLVAGKITREEHDAAVERDIVFNRGRTSFALNTVMDLVKDGLATDVVSKAMDRHGISNISTSGARIITTVDKELQADTLYSLRTELSRLDVRLRGYDRKEVQEEYAALRYRGDSELREKAFVFGTVENVDTSDPQSPVIRVGFGPQKSPGYIDRDGLEQMLVALVKYRKQKWEKPKKKDLAELLSRIHAGDRIYCAVRELDLFDETPTLDMHKFPKIQGAALVMQQGMIRAMAGGMENRFFNRAVTAKRLMGSTFKPFLFSAALQLGWSSIDRLDNRRNLFVFMGQPYFPRPDHHSPFTFVSMSWAGVKSENVAAVWLLYHLTDQLTEPRLAEVAGWLDMAPRKFQGRSESYQRFKERMRDRFGIRVTRNTLDRAAYDRAVKNMEADFLFDDRAGEYLQWKNMPYGLAFDKYRALQRKGLAGPKLKAWQRNEYHWRLGKLPRNYLELVRVQEQLLQYRRYLSSLSRQTMDPLSYFDTASIGRPEGSFVRDQEGRLIFTRSSHLREDWQLVTEMDLRDELAGLFPGEENEFWQGIWLEGHVRSSSLTLVQEQTRLEREKLAAVKPYSMTTLASVSDYRVMLGLQYLIRLAREAGINSSDLDPVLSFPLGSNVVSLLETVRMYETLVTGNRYDALELDGFEEVDMEPEDQDGLAVIDRIEDAEGTIIYSRQTTAVPVLDIQTSSALSSILQNTVHYGTGRHAWKTVRLHSDNDEREKKLAAHNLALPLMGKTGTANDYRNAAFMGYVPIGASIEKGVLALHTGYTVGVYTGFDSNERLVKGSTHISGSQGALPTWSKIAEALFKMERTADQLILPDKGTSSIGLQYPDSGQMFVPVNYKGGGVVLEGQGAAHSLVPPLQPVVLSYGQVGAGNRFEPERTFRPFWQNQQ